MQGNLNALGLLLVVGLTVFALVRYPKPPNTLRQIFYAIIFGILLIFLGCAFGNHMCTAGQPFTQYIIPGICLTLVMMFTAQKQKVTYCIIWGIALLSVVLTFQFNYLVHGDEYTGNPTRVKRGLLSFQRSKLEAINAELSYYDEHHRDHPRYPAGWVAENSVLHKYFKGAFDSLYAIEEIEHSRNAATFPLWHSWFTGLYGKHMTDLYLWYPGGKISEAIGKLEYRPRLRRQVLGVIRCY